MQCILCNAPKFFCMMRLMYGAHHGGGGDYEDDEHDCDGDQLIGSISRFTG